MKSSEFIFDDSDSGNQYNEKYLHSTNVDPFVEIHSLIESNDFDLASDKLNRLYTSHLATYNDDPMMLGLVYIISNIQVTYDESLFCDVRSAKKTLCVPHRLAHEMRSIQDVMFFVLFERARMIVDRTQHISVKSLGMDLAVQEHQRIFNAAVGMWGSAITRCYTSSTIPERIHVNSNHPMSALLHGFDPQGTCRALRAMSFDRTASVFSKLYEMHGQEPFHIELGRLPPTNEEQVKFRDALWALWEDHKSNGDTDPSNSDNDDCLFTRGDDDKIQGNSNDMSKDLYTVPVPDIDVDSALGEYLNNVIANDPRLNFGYDTNTFDSNSLRSTIEKFNLSGLVEALNSSMPLKYLAPTPSSSLSLDDYSKIAQGYMPSMFEVEVEPTKRQEERYFLYVDVSYSMFVWWPVIRSIIRTMRPLIDMNNIYAFSTVVTKIDEKLTQFETTNRTSISCALKHAQDLGQHKIILVTDLEDDKLSAFDMDVLVLATFPNDTFQMYTKMMRSGKQLVEDTCLCNIRGKVDIHPVFLTDLMK